MILMLWMSALWARAKISLNKRLEKVLFSNPRFGANSATSGVGTLKIRAFIIQELKVVIFTLNGRQRKVTMERKAR